MKRTKAISLRFRYLIPAYRLSRANIINVLTRLPYTTSLPLVVYNDDINSPTLSQIQDLESNGKATLLLLPHQVGKAEAVRQGLAEILQDENIEAVVQVDGRQKQPPEDVALLMMHLQESGADMVIANRYAFQNLSNAPHRKIISSSLSAIVQALTGISVPDAACGTRAYRIPLARKFLKLRSFGYGLEVEQLIIAGLTSSRVLHVPVHSKPQENYTPAEKIEDNLMSLISYSAELKIPDKAKDILCYILAQIKQRRDFTCDLSPLGIPKHINAHAIVSPTGYYYTLLNVAPSFKHSKEAKVLIP